VHLIPHTHLDPGCLQTFDQYYRGWRLTIERKSGWGVSNCQVWCGVWHVLWKQLFAGHKNRFELLGLCVWGLVGVGGDRMGAKSHSAGWWECCSSGYRAITSSHPWKGGGGMARMEGVGTQSTSRPMLKCGM
jgi:hypothetical protein